MPLFLDPPIAEGNSETTVLTKGLTPSVALLNICEHPSTSCEFLAGPDLQIMGVALTPLNLWLPLRFECHDNHAEDSHVFWSMKWPKSQDHPTSWLGRLQVHLKT